MNLKVYGVVLCLCWLFIVSANAKPIDENTHKIDIPRQPLITSLNFLSNQTETLILFSYDLVEALEGNAVKGNFSAEEALDLLLENSGLAGGVSDSGVLTISKYNKENPNMKYQKTILASIISLLASGANAQSGTDSDTAETKQTSFLEEIVVTAQKRQQNANDIGVAISTISGDMLQELGVYDATDLATAIPGLTFGDTGFSTPVYTLRGVGFNENSVQAAATVGVYNDQIAVPFPIMTKGLLMDLQRIEVLKGPQGTLYGRNSTGGAINYIANKPSEEFEASAELGYSSFETTDVSGVVSGPLSDSVAARFAVRSLQSSEGWQESVSRNDTHGEKDKLSARLLMDINATDNLDINLAASWWQDKSDTQTPQFWQSSPQRASNSVVVGLQNSVRVPLLGTDDNQASDWTAGNNLLGSGPKADMSSSSVSVTVNWDINDAVKLTSLSNFSDFSNNSTYTNDGNPGLSFDDSFDGVTVLETINPLALPLYDGLDTVGGVWYQNKSEIESWSQELRFSGQQDILTWAAGVYFSGDEIESDTPQYVEFATSTNRFHTIGTGLQVVTNPTEQDSEAWAVFGHTEWEMADTLKLTVGLRYTEEEKEFRACTADAGLGDSADFLNLFFGPVYSAGECTIFIEGGSPGDFAQKELNEDAWSGKLALDWMLNDDTLTYASYSRGFKGGSFPTLTTSDGSQYDPAFQEQVDAYELGIKSTLLEGAMQLNAAAYYYDYKDKQLLSKVITIFGASNALDNAPESSVTGAEIDLQWAPIEGLFINLGASYTDTEVKEFIGFNQLGLEGDMSGSAFPLTPKYQATALVNYEWDMGDNLTAFLGADLSYSDSFKTDYDIKTIVDGGNNGSGYARLLSELGVSAGQSYAAQDVFTIDSTTLLGAQMGIRSADDQWSATLWGRNLSDEYRVSNTRKSSDSILAWTGMPRTVGITLNYNW